MGLYVQSESVIQSQWFAQITIGVKASQRTKQPVSDEATFFFFSLASTHTHSIKTPRPCIRDATLVSERTLCNLVVGVK
jgi:hypothetical protein